MGAIAFGLKIEEETLGEVFFVFDEDDERSGGLKSCGFLSAGKLNASGCGCLLYLAVEQGREQTSRPFQAIWTPMQKRIKAMTRRIPCTVEGETERAILGAYA